MHICPAHFPWLMPLKSSLQLPLPRLHVGAWWLQSPEAWQILVPDPDNSYPGSHTKVTLVSTGYDPLGRRDPPQYTFPFLRVNGAQSTAVRTFYFVSVKLYWCVVYIFVIK